MDSVVLRIAKTVIGALGIIGNGLVCVVIAKVPAMRTLTNAFIFNQAVIDFLASVSLIISSNTDFTDRFRSPLSAVIYCYIWHTNFYLWVFYVASVFNLVVLTFERYIAIVYPFKYAKLFRPKQAAFLISAVWILSFGYKSYLFATRRITNTTKCEIREVAVPEFLGVATICIEYFAPLGLMAFSYVRIIICLKRGAARVAHLVVAPRVRHELQAETLRGSLVRAKRNTVKTLLLVSITFAVCWSVNQLIFFMYNLGWQLDFNGFLYIFSVSLAAFNSCANPFIYSIKYRQFKQGARQLFLPRRFSRNMRPTVASTSINLAAKDFKCTET